MFHLSVEHIMMLYLLAAVSWTWSELAKRSSLQSRSLPPSR
jgi:hypothetical protein